MFRPLVLLLGSCLFFELACSSPKTQDPTPLTGRIKPAPGHGVFASQNRSHSSTASEVKRFHAHLMGTPFMISLPVASKVTEALVGQAFDEVSRIEGMMSEWQADSEVSAINRAAGVKAVPISEELFSCLRKAQAISDQTGGAFDVTWAALRGLWNFSPDAKIPSKKILSDALGKVGYQQLVLDDVGKTAFLKLRGMSIGLGAIAKGYGIDRAVGVLRKQGLKNFIVDGGGDLYFAGEKSPGEPWTVGVKHPRNQNQIVAELSVRDAAVVSSGDYERFFERNGLRYHHILDLGNGQPARKSVAVTVRASDATFADAIATALFVLGPKEGLKFVQLYPDVDAAIFSPDGGVHSTSGFQGAFPTRWDVK